MQGKITASLNIVYVEHQAFGIRALGKFRKDARTDSESHRPTDQAYLTIENIVVTAGV